MSDYQYLLETTLEAFERRKHAVASVFVKGPEYLVEHEQADRAAGLESNVLTDGHSQREVGEIGFGTAESVHAIGVAGVGDLQVERLGVDL